MLIFPLTKFPAAVARLIRAILLVTANDISNKSVKVLCHTDEYYSSNVSDDPAMGGRSRLQPVEIPVTAGDSEL